MNILNEYESRFDAITNQLEGSGVGIIEKIGLLWVQRQILKDWKRSIERLKREKG